MWKRLALFYGMGWDMDGDIGYRFWDITARAETLYHWKSIFGVFRSHVTSPLAVMGM